MRIPEVGAWSAPVKLVAFAAAALLLAALAYGLGTAADPIAVTAGADHDEEPAASGADSEGMEGMEGGAVSAAVRGLAVTDKGYDLSVAITSLPAGVATPFELTVTGPDGAPVTDYELTHEKNLHLIVVRRDLTEFQHVHPEQGSDGAWRIPLTLPTAGTYRVFADFAPAALGGESLTLGSDIAAGGSFQPAPLPPSAGTATVDDLRVSLAGTPVAGAETELTFSVARDGEPVDDLEPYLGAFGHLVSLRVGDLAYLHTHPIEEATRGTTGGPDVVFGTTFPSAGTYRLFLDFSVDGKVRTAAFTVTVPAADGSGTATEPSADASEEPMTEHSTEEPAHD